MSLSKFSFFREANSFRSLTISALSLFLLFPMNASSKAADREELVSRYPGLEDKNLRPENPKIICPFHRLLERAGLYDSAKDSPGPLLVSILKITNIAREFGCDVLQCGTVATAVSGGQVVTRTSYFNDVNLESLHTALGVSHDCGLAFAKGGTEVNASHRARTLSALAERQDANGRLQYEDLVAVKEGICAEQGVRNTFAGKTEMKLIYSFLGGKKRGYIDYSDVERFLNAELPLTVDAPDGI
ncbi:MAG: hypothetical protein EOP07_14065 [Proteobacteria bacterium]|nr:MAG: hypothetical protein EOP07_14065 [Pseudomonadota bacterium]